MLGLVIICVQVIDIIWGCDRIIVNSDSILGVRILKV